MEHTHTHTRTQPLTDPELEAEADLHSQNRNKNPSPLDLLLKGYSIIPLKALDKSPAMPWKQFQERKVSVATLRTWQNRGINWGAVTGSISGFVALDFDNKAADRYEQYLPKHPTPLVRTPRGIHIYFKHPGPGPQQVLGNRSLRRVEIDLRGDGGYVVIPPSSNHNGQYWMWMISPLEAELQPIPQRVWDLINR